MPAIKFLNVGELKEKVFPRKYKDGAMRTTSDYSTEGEYGILKLDEDAVAKLWQAVESDEALLAMLPDLYKSKGRVLIVDDYGGTGATEMVAQSLLHYNFPEIDFKYYSVFNENDQMVFKVPGQFRAGPYFPWNVDKALTGVENDDDETSVISKRVNDKEEQKRSVALRREIKEIFGNFKTSSFGC